MIIDSQFTKKIQDWLNTNPKTASMAQSGAMLLRQIAPNNRIYMRFFSMSMSSPDKILPKIAYELGIHLKYRLDGLTLQQVNQLDQITVPEAEGIINSGQPVTDGVTKVMQHAATDDSDSRLTTITTVKLLGKRADHDSLPDDIRQLWVDNGILYKDIKANYEQLKAMTELPSCQRYDILQLMASQDRRYLAQMERYDKYHTSDKADEAANNTEDDNRPTDPDQDPDKKHADSICPTDPDQDPDKNPAAESAQSDNSITNARSYISKYLQALSSAYDKRTVDPDGYNAIRNKVQERVDTIVAAKAAMGDELKAALASSGIIFHGED